jgi:hypothetical protein
MGDCVTREQLKKIAAIALQIAAFPSKSADAGVSARRGIPAFLIEELREALDDAGVDWRAFRDEHSGSSRR